MILTRNQIATALNLCGCLPDTVLDEYERIVREIESGRFHFQCLAERFEDTVKGDMVAHALLNAMDAAGIIEHGTGIRAPWISPDAKDLPEDEGWAEEGE